MYGMKHSILVATPSWGDVYIAFRSDTTVLELFWNGNRVLSANQRKAALAWLSAEGWFAYAMVFLLAHAPVDQLIDGTLHMGGRNTLSVPVASAYPLTDSRFTYK